MQTNLDITIASYDRTAAAYSEKTLDIDTSPQRNTFLSNLPEKSLILDVGCGPGRDAKLFSEGGYLVTGIDLSEKLLEIARTHAPNAEFQKMDVMQMNFPDKHFDGIWAMSVLMHLEKKDIYSAISECCRVVRPGGMFYFCLKRGLGEGIEIDQRYGVPKYYAYYCEDEINKMIASTSFKVIKSDSTTIDKAYATKPWMDIFLQRPK